MSRYRFDDIGAYTIVPKWVQQRCVTEARALQLYAWLGVYANTNTGVGWPKRETLAAALGVSVRSIARALEFLRRVGAVRTTLTHQANGAVGGLSFQLIRCEPDDEGLQATPGTKADAPSGQIVYAKRPTVSSPIKGRTRSELEGARKSARTGIPLARPRRTKRPESRRRYPVGGGGGNCPHEPQCHTFTDCRDRILAEGRAERAQTAEERWGRETLPPAPDRGSNGLLSPPERPGGHSGDMTGRA